MATVRAATSRERYQARPGRAACVAAELGELHGPVTGTVRLPLWLSWSQPDLEFDLGDPDMRRWLYQIVLREAGLRTERRDSGGLADIFDGMGEGLAEWLVTGPGGEQMMLQMAYFDRARKPVTMDLGPVLDLEDVVGGKVAALASRAEPRDYVDTAAALDRYTIRQMIGFARRLDPGLTQRDFADAGRRLDQWGDGVFAAFGLTPADIARLRERFAAWPR
jgi:hypothetical protein